MCDKAGVMRELKSGWHPQLDPCCFPLLHPRGTFGWRFFMKKKGYEEKEETIVNEQTAENLEEDDNCFMDEDTENMENTILENQVIFFKIK